MDHDPFKSIVVLIIVLASGALATVLTVAAFYGSYWLLTLPMRRNERARLFLDLLELGLRQGLTPEQVVVASSWSRDRALGVRFHLLAAELEQGLSLGKALERVPRLVPIEVGEMLRAGERIGDIARVLPACRRVLKDDVSQVRGALNYVLVLTLATVPLLVLAPGPFVRVWPRYQEVFEGMYEGFVLPAFTRLILDHSFLLVLAQAGAFAFLLLLALVYIAGPRLRSGLNVVAPRLMGQLHWALPWRRARIRRNFSALLALLLDAGVPEPEALRLAAECTQNGLVRHRAGLAGRLLARGVALPDALQMVDDSREFQWRLANAFQGRTPVAETLKGWFESLDARAFRYEQTAAQLATTGMVLFNGLIVGSILIAVFLCLIELTNHAVLW